MPPNDANLENLRADTRASYLSKDKSNAALAPPVEAEEKNESRATNLKINKAWEVLKTFAIVFSFVVNLVFLLVLLVAGSWLFDIKTAIVSPLVGGLNTSFVEMDKSHIRTTILVSDTIRVNDTIPVVFDLPVSTETVVVLTQNTRVPNTTVFLNGAPIPTDIVLPAGTRLGIKLDITVPVSQTVPVALTVPVNLQIPIDIPLDQTDLHQPFVRLRRTVEPYNTLLNDLPATWDEALCRYAALCFLSASP